MRVPWNVTFDWDEDKNRRLRQDRGIGFEEMVIAIAHEGLRDVLQHPNQERYPDQMIYVVEYNDYCYAVPFVQRREEEIVFLKTSYASRKLTRDYRTGS